MFFLRTPVKTENTTKHKSNTILKWQMQQITRSLDITVTETFRHLQRLTEAKLVEKKVDSTYAITSQGKLATGFLSGFNFVLKKVITF